MAVGKEKNNRPVKRFKSWGIEASVWKHDKGYSVTIRKQYKDDQGDWQDTTTFFPDDLPRLILVAQKAYEYIELME